MKISIQGTKGSFHHIVAQNAFGQEHEIIERSHFKEVFEDVAFDRSDKGIIAIENSIAGSILENFDFLLKYDVFVVGEYYLRISHQLITLPETKMEDITEVLSHPMAIKQCESFLNQHPDWKPVGYTDTAQSVIKIKNEQLKNSAAIASKMAAEIYQMKIIAADIETNKQNYTRFLILQKKVDYQPGINKTSLVCSVKHQPGMLAKLLDIFSAGNINLSKIESRPILGTPWEYYFYIDVETGINEPNMQKAMLEIKETCSMLKVLGSYKKHKLSDTETSA